MYVHLLQLRVPMFVPSVFTHQRVIVSTGVCIPRRSYLIAVYLVGTQIYSVGSWVNHYISLSLPKSVDWLFIHCASKAGYRFFSTDPLKAQRKAYDQTPY